MAHPGAVVVDVSNVCWSGDLAPRAHGAPGPVLGRLDTLITAWRGLHGADAPMTLVADRSLRHCLPPRDRSRWPSVARELDIQTAPVADELILRQAAESGLWVVTRDHYLDHRRHHRWIEQHPERFLRWRADGRAVSFEPLGITSAPHQLVSQHEEAKELKRVGLDTRRHREILLTRWRCANPRCLQARLWQDALLLWPEVDRDDRATCPSCRAPLTALGPRAAVRQLIVSAADDPDTEIIRFPLEAGTPVVLGRGRLECGVSLDGLPRSPARINRLSRQHVAVRLDEQGALSVVDMESANGTEVRNPGAADFRRLNPGDWVNVADRGQVRLGGVVVLELSGQRFLADPRRPPEHDHEAPATEISTTYEGRH
ncbi:hypothetical protein Cs7R123_01800 [Catellatospora sp. TT07R-123]|uniref:FHA domain-containing protein n=1 Tax=Catellatospora sp. TT07R-123 TaxID=2733863 RepID=UPI001AFE55D2|nr:FHA domain-containing protein [Catellatospora sp. TT07R-123]GHJ42838.1 hypothetical protein Cs7R123_01800 [Catellatospora sp. TT07R-123]